MYHMECHAWRAFSHLAWILDYVEQTQYSIRSDKSNKQYEQMDLRGLYLMLKCQPQSTGAKLATICLFSWPTMLLQIVTSTADVQKPTDSRWRRILSDSLKQKVQHVLMQNFRLDRKHLSMKWVKIQKHNRTSNDTK